NKKAFTLTEMIVVIAIIGILAGVLIPTITGYIKRANQSAAYQEAEAVLNIYETWKTETESGLTNYTYFENYYEEISGEELESNYYIKYLTVEDHNLGNEVSLLYVKDKIIVEINLDSKEVTYLNNNPIPDTLYGSVYGSLKDALV
ncbi:MAG: type II secretion system protein, partial [Bacilli bacterium]|nr:type II secretion system protein [Bacilli bacterium]